MELRHNKIAIGLFIIFMYSCGNKETNNTPQIKLFNKVSAEKSGVHFSNKLTTKENLNIIDYLYYYNGGGVAVGDLNNDGLDDIYFTANQSPDKLYLNKGDLTFEDISITAGIPQDSTWSTGVTMADLNNDGLLDIYVAKVGLFEEGSHNQAYINQGDLTFKESAKELGIDFKGFSTQSAFFDYDNDGDMDMYLLNHSTHTPNSYGKTSKRLEKDSLAGDRFYENKLNEGSLVFEDVTDSAGIYSSALGYGLGINTSDINGDGLIDIYVGNDFHENDYLYLNTGEKSFEEQSAKYLQHSSRFTMGLDIGDLNGDNRPDIFTLDMMPYDREIFLKSGGEDKDKVTQIKKGFGYQTQYARNTMQINNTTGFSDVAPMTKSHATDWSWSALIQDFDNDGRNDIFITNGIYKRPNDLDYINYLSTKDFAQYTKENNKEIERQLIEKMPSIKIPNVLLKNEGNFTFTRLTDEIGLNDSYSNGAAYSDLDNDGDLDLVINNIDQEATILENVGQSSIKQNYVQVELKENELCKNVNGTKVIIYSQGKSWLKELTPTRGFQSASTRKLHFGLGESSLVDSIQIIWLDKQIQTEKGIAVNTKIRVEKKAGTRAYDYATPIGNTFTKFPFLHFENDYLDYVREPLMPEKLSTEGPAVVYADLDNDGFKDLFVGGARYQKPFFYKGSKTGAFSSKNIPAFSIDERYEDVDAVAFDLENDGDLDLYVQSGGNDKPQGDPLLEDRVYINLGNGNFERLEATLPSTNGGCLAVADYNNDGFADLFIGSRSVPGAYGISPVSLILKNNGNSGFSVVAQDKLGMVSDAQWTDLNNDGFQDLIVVGDWMPITILMNQKNGKFKYDTPNLGLENTAGLWNTIEVADIDDNGYKDIIAGNVGENFKWTADAKKPVKLYISDFDENDQLDPIIFYPLFDNYVPFANREALNAQLPYLAKRFNSYEEFSKIKNVEDLTGIPEKSIETKKEIHELRSMVYLNMGDSLIGHPLNKKAQQSTIQDVQVYDNKIMYVGNYKGFVTELGNSDANAGGILSKFNQSEHSGHTSLHIPGNLEYRKIIHLENGSFLVFSNNGNTYILK